MLQPQYASSSATTGGATTSHALPGQRPHPPARKQDRRFADALGWFSIGLGLAELLVPRRLGRVTGVGEHPVLLPLLGLREIASGVGILVSRDQTLPVRSRVVGDVLDLALLGSALVTTRGERGERGRIVAATAAVAGVTALDVLCSRQLAANNRGATWSSGPIELAKSIAINRPADELFRFFRELENLPRVMSHLQSVRAEDASRSRWVASLPGDKPLEWETEITQELPNELLAWRSLEGSPMSHSGFVHFRALPEGRGTMVSLKLELDAREGSLAAGITKLFGEVPELVIGEDLRKLKQLMETGEIASTDGQPSGRRSLISRYLP
jgi:uncharacterized membrane protein